MGDHRLRGQRAKDMAVRLADLVRELTLDALSHDEASVQMGNDTIEIVDCDDPAWSKVIITGRTITIRLPPPGRGRISGARG